MKAQSFLFNLLVMTVAVMTAMSCNRQDEIVTLRNGDVADGGTLLCSDLVSEVEFIALDSDTVVAYGIGDCVISDKYVARVDFGYSTKLPVRVFDRSTGKLIACMGHIGRGPGEYQSTFQVALDDKGDKVWIRSKSGLIDIYDVFTGIHVGEVPMAYDMDEFYMLPEAVFSIDKEGKSIAVASIPYDDDSTAAFVWEQDLEGNVLWEIPRTGRWRSSSPANTNISSDCNVDGALEFSLKSDGNYPDTLYLLRDRELIPLFTVDLKSFKDGTSMMHSLLPGKVLSTVFGRGEELFPGVIVSESQGCILTDLRTGKALRYGSTSMHNDFLDIEGVLSFRNGYLINLISPDEFREAARSALDNGLLTGRAAEQASEILSDLSDEDNDILMLGRLKR